MRLLKWQLIRSKQQSNERHKMKNIIIAEDEFVIRLSITDKLQRLGYTAHATENGAQALQMILEGTETPDLLITDIQMPEMGGYELLEELQSRGYQIPVIVHSTDFDRDKTNYSGPLEFSSKCQNPCHLYEVVQNILNNS